MKMRAAITAVNGYLPEFKLSNHVLETMVETSDAWITERIKEVAKRHAKGRIVSCLEGGYDLSSLARSVEAHLRALADL